ncbi:MAG: hypothetical protein U0805_00425 [Pirellulales bacterium]
MGAHSSWRSRTQVFELLSLSALALHWLNAAAMPCVAAVNLASTGNAIFGASSAIDGGVDYPIVNQGSLSELNDGVVVTDAALLGLPGAFTINANGSAGQNGNGADTYAGSSTPNQFDYVGILFLEPAYGVTSVRVQNYLANDGGWWGPYGGSPTNAPLGAGDLAAPQVQVTRDGGATWANIAATSSDYVAKYTGVPRGTGFPNATAGPLATITFAQQDGIDGIRLIQNGAGNVDAGPGFIGVTEFEVFGVPQELKLIVNTSTGIVSIASAVLSDIAFDFYRISSASGSLNANGWNGLHTASGNASGFPAGDGSGNGWEVLGVPATTSVTEGYLSGSSAIVAGNSPVELGNLFAAGGTHDLTFRYRTAAGRFVDVTNVQYVSEPSLPGDYNGNSSVDAVDFVIWRQNLNRAVAMYNDATPGTVTDSDYAVWREHFGEVLAAPTARENSTRIVPEPGSFIFFLAPASYVVMLAPRSGGLNGGRIQLKQQLFK